MSSNDQHPATAHETVKTRLDAIAKCFEQHHVAEPDLKAELILSYVIGCPRLELPMKYEDPIDERMKDAVQYYVDEIASGLPLQYVLGEVDFMGLKLAVDGRALIPRPETERLIDTLLGDASIWSREAPAVIDVGTGSGCIVLALARAKTHASYVATDVRAEALQLARENALKLGLDDAVQWVLCDLLGACMDESLDLVVSNPPYIATSEVDRLDPQVRYFEPRWALDGGPDGISVIDRLVPDACRGLKSGGKLYMEIGETQAPSVGACMETAGFVDIGVVKDLADRDRIIMGTKP